MAAADRRVQLLDVAHSTFGTDGDHTTSMIAVAKAAGVTKPVLYQHFESKEELFLELLRSITKRISEAVTAAATSTDDPHQQVVDGTKAYFKFFAEEPPAFTVMYGDGVRAVPKFADERRAMELTLATNLAALIHIEGISDDERMAMAHGILGLNEGITRYWFEVDGSQTHEVIATMSAELAWAGLRGGR